MAKTQNILVGVDLHHGDRLASSDVGPECQAAVNEAILLASGCGGTVTFCSVLELSAQSQTLIENDRENTKKTVEDIASTVLTQLVSVANSKGIAAESKILFGTAWEALARESASGEYDLLMIGTKPQSRTATLLFGSTAQKLMRYAPCPVWIVKPSEVREIREIAVATDLSESCLPVLRIAAKIAESIEARLFVIHVLESGDLRNLAIAGVAEEELADTESLLKKNAEQKMKQQLSHLDSDKLPHGLSSQVLPGDPDAAIPEFVRQNNVDLLVIGTHGRDHLAGLLLGNTAERVLPNLNASLLAVKPEGYHSPYAP